MPNVYATKRTLIRRSGLKSSLPRFTSLELVDGRRARASSTNSSRPYKKALCQRNRPLLTKRIFWISPFDDFARLRHGLLKLNNKAWSPTCVLTNAVFSIWTVHKNTFFRNACLHPTDGGIRLSDRAYISGLPSLPIPTSPNMLWRANTSQKNQSYYFPDIPCTSPSVYFSVRSVF